MNMQRAQRYDTFGTRTQHTERPDTTREQISGPGQLSANLVKEEKPKTGLQTNDQNKAILQSLKVISQACPSPLKFPLVDGTHVRDEVFLDEHWLNRDGLFKKPEPIQGSRLAVVVEHRGLGEERTLDNALVMKRRRALTDRAERLRRARREYFESLLQDLQESGDFLGKRAVDGVSRVVNPLGVPDNAGCPRDLIRRLHPYQLGNYPTPCETPAVRIRALNDSTLFDGKRVLELGCGDGQFLLEIAKQFRPALLKGVDADPNLIESAARQTRAIKDASQEAVLAQGVPVDWVPLSFRSRGKPRYLTLSTRRDNCGLMTREQQERDAIQITFETENIVTDITKYRLEQFDSLICLSVVKWVHLNWGDAGLTRLLLKFYNSLLIGGRLILDIHSWKSYKRKKRFCQAFEYTFSTLTIKPKGIISRLQHLGFELERIVTPSYDTELKRPIYILRKAH